MESTQPTINSARPAQMAHRRPIESERRPGTEHDAKKECGNDELHIVAPCRTEITDDLGQRRKRHT